MRLCLMVGLDRSIICLSLKTTHLVVLPPQDFVVKPRLFFCSPRSLMVMVDLPLLSLHKYWPWPHLFCVFHLNC